VALFPGQTVTFSPFIRLYDKSSINKIAMTANPFATYRLIFLIGFCVLGMIAALA
jgi:hypothetical protein